MAKDTSKIISTIILGLYVLTGTYFLSYTKELGFTQIELVVIFVALIVIGIFFGSIVLKRFNRSSTLILTDVIIVLVCSILLGTKFVLTDRIISLFHLKP